MTRADLAAIAGKQICLLRQALVQALDFFTKLVVSEVAATSDVEHRTRDAEGKIVALQRVPDAFAVFDHHCEEKHQNAVETLLP